MRHAYYIKSISDKDDILNKKRALLNLPGSDSKLKYKPNEDIQNYPLCSLKTLGTRHSCNLQSNFPFPSSQTGQFSTTQYIKVIFRAS